jgi:uncharacterized protein (TIGR02996 family)
MSDSSVLLALLDACKDDPADDGPRLVLADWLEDHEEPDRAEFIRVQIAQARLPAWAPEQPELWVRYVELLEQHQADWTASLRPFGIQKEDVQFHRGLIEVPGRPWRDPSRLLAAQWDGATREALAWADRLGVAVDRPTWAAQLGEWLASTAVLAAFPCLDLQVEQVTDALGQLADNPHAPVLRELRLSGGNRRDSCAGPLRALAEAPALAGLRRLAVSLEGARDEDLVPLVTSPRLARLEDLHLGPDGRLGDAVLLALADCPGRASLRRLSVETTSLSPEAVAALAASPHLTGLRDLTLRLAKGSGSAVGDALADSPLLARLTRLTLYCDPGTPGEAGALALAGSQACAGLRELNLQGHLVTPGTAAALSSSSHLGSLEVLRLCGALGDDGLAALVAGQGLPSVCCLDLGSNGIGPAGLKALAASPHLPGLRVLLLLNNPLGAGAAELGTSAHLGRLEVLDLSRTRVTRAALAALARGPVLGNLRRLNLASNALRANHLADLCSGTGLTRLIELDLDSNSLNDDALRRLAACPALGELQLLHLAGNTLSPDGVAALAASPHLGRLRAIRHHDHAVLRAWDELRPAR